eukprot:CAMPEP_0169118528 /NCGR_PEP_ID=MMETSP1015-20121227/31046_1 /TAXON_ID=342587 /ORGANISM="Karlodinium micrum, Strain CCMP2283" /LENGTH=195 /DNA_ID=CAMNT_0009181297 /DNA_START=106 /DNA_END=692 /DNA_ORIENTATION=+
MAQTRAASTSRMISEMADPDYTQAFYKTANSDYCGTWHDGTRGDSVSEVVPTISDVLGARPTVRKPVRPLKATAKCVLANKIQEARNERLADKVLSADVIPKKYPVTAENFNYPPNVKHGADNPLYSTSSQAYGSQMPMSSPNQRPILPIHKPFHQGIRGDEAAFHRSHNAPYFVESAQGVGHFLLKPSSGSYSR